MNLFVSSVIRNTNVSWHTSLQDGFPWKLLLIMRWDSSHLTFYQKINKSPRFERFREHFENPILEAYLSFYQFSLKVFIKLNLLLQREDPLISHVHGHIQRFLKKLTLKFLNSVRNSPRRSANAEAFAEAYLRFSVSPSAKKMLRQLNDDVDDVFHTNFKLDFMTQIIYCIIHIFLCSLFILLLFSLNSF